MIGRVLDPVSGVGEDIFLSIPGAVSSLGLILLEATARPAHWLELFMRSSPGGCGKCHRRTWGNIGKCTGYCWLGSTVEILVLENPVELTQMLVRTRNFPVSDEGASGRLLRSSIYFTMHERNSSQSRCVFTP